MDSLEVLPRTSMVPVYDASGNQLAFLGAVKLVVKVEVVGNADVSGREGRGDNIRDQHTG